MKAAERFLRYVTYHTTSNEESTTVPSTDRQKVFGQALVEEMKELGISDAKMDENGYVSGSIKASEGRENDPVIGLISHMDTSPSMSGENVKPVIIKNYEGGDIVLNKEKNKKGRRDPGAFIWYLKKTRLRGSRSMIKKLKNELFSSKRTGCFAWTRSGRLKHQGGHFCLIFPLTISLIAGNIR